jgi:hypothetical protein
MEIEEIKNELEKEIAFLDENAKRFTEPNEAYGANRGAKAAISNCLKLIKQFNEAIDKRSVIFDFLEKDFPYLEVETIKKILDNYEAKSNITAKRN